MLEDILPLKGQTLGDYFDRQREEHGRRFIRIQAARGEQAALWSYVDPYTGDMALVVKPNDADTYSVSVKEGVEDA